MAKRKKTHPSKGSDYGASALNPLLYLDVTKALLHISICNENDSRELLDDLRNLLASKSPFKVTVHRLIIKEHRNFSSEKFSKEEVTIDVPIHLLESLLVEDYKSSDRPAGQKICQKYVKVDITQMVKDWYKSSKKNHGLFVTVEPTRLKHLVSLKQTENVRLFMNLPTIKYITATTLSLSLSLETIPRSLDHKLPQEEGQALTESSVQGGRSRTSLLHVSFDGGL